MKTLAAGLAAHLDSGTTTLSRCWKLIRTDGVALGFTDHDRTIVLDELACEPASGFTATEAVAELGLAVGGLDIDGALASERIAEADLIGGLYDGAAIEVWLVNWADPTERLLLRRGDVGEIERADGAFRAEIRSLAHVLDQEQGRLFHYLCDADLGDSRCKIDLDDPAFRATGTVVTAFDNRNFAATGLEAFAAGDAFTISAGCDKRFPTCVEKFANALNYRGFPHMPGNDFALSYPHRGTGRNDGGSMNQ